MSDEFWTMFNTLPGIQAPVALPESLQDITQDPGADDQSLGLDLQELGKREKEIIYRGKMGALFKELNKLIPPQHRKCNSRLSVLEKTIDFIHQLKLNQTTLQQDKNQLIEENFRLRQLIQLYSSNSTKTFPSPTKSFTL